jgi:hypothetical protein
VNTKNDSDTMDPTALYYAPSTIAQGAAALAALIGFLGLWRLNRLREEYDQAARDVGWLLTSAPVSDPRVTNITVHTLHRDIIIRAAEHFITKYRDSQDDTLRSVALKIEATLKRWRAKPGDQHRVMGVLQRFLRRALVILALAILGLVFAYALNAWVVTALIARLLIILAGYRLWRDTASVVREAVRSIRSLVILAVLLALASSALAGPVRSPTYAEQTLAPLQNPCGDGTQAVSTWSSTLHRWQTMITASPRPSCTWQPNPRTQQVEVRCRSLMR